MPNMHISGRTSLLTLLKEEDKKKYYCALVDGKIRSLSFVIDKEGDYDITFLDFTSQETTRMYSASMRYLISLATKIVAPNLSLRFYYNISRAIFAKVVNPKNFSLDPELVDKIKEKMKQLISMDIPFEKIKVSKEKALDIYKKLGFKDKIRVLKYRSEDFVHLYEAKCDEIDYFDYLYSPLVPSSGYLKEFTMNYYAPGFVCMVPRSELGGKIPQFVDESKFAAALQRSSHWEEINHLDTVSDINRFIKQYSAMSLINLSETRFNNMLAELGNDIMHNDTPIRLVLVAGPSSSGKTSFANRLLYELMSKGLRPIRISMDDYFIPRKEMKPGVSLESVDAVDIALFNRQMDELIRGKSVALPTYDFKTHERSFGKKISLEQNEPIIIEGIHALNSQTCRNIPNTQKYRIYIAPQPQVNIDDHTPISMTDMRLLRRIARDARTRNTDALKTIDMWPSVRYGEFHYIYSTQENADYVFDSFLPYELSAIHDIVLPQLLKIKPEQKEYPMAHRLVNMVRYCVPIETDDIPCNSLMREFVGGSSFKDAR